MTSPPACTSSSC
jgi:hypothetical protein